MSDQENIQTGGSAAARVNKRGALMSATEALISERSWERHDGVAVVECPDCAFCFAADHEDVKGGYSCPACAEMSLREALGDLLHWVNQTPTLANVDLMPGWWVRGRITRKRGEKLMAE